MDTEVEGLDMKGQCWFIKKKATENDLQWRT